MSSFPQTPEIPIRCQQIRFLESSFTALVHSRQPVATRPQKRTTLWAWEVYWVTTASFAWLILPIAGAFLTIPNYLDVLAACRMDVMLRSLGLGVIYGVGGLTFGLGIRDIGFSLNYAIAIGISAGLGTLFPLIWHPNRGFVWEMLDKFSTLPGQVVLAGILISLGGIAVCGWAGVLRERAGGDSPSQYSFKVGVPLAHGSDRYDSVWRSVCEEICVQIKENSGIDRFEYAFVQVGQQFSERGVPAIERALKDRPRVLVVGLYLSLSVKGRVAEWIARTALDMAQHDER